MLEKSLHFIRTKLTRSHNKIFIIPSRYGLYFIAIVFVLFLISLSYGHSLAFTTTFIFVSLVMTSAHFTNYNLAGVEVLSLYTPEEAYAGEECECKVTLRNASRKTRFDLVVTIGNRGESKPFSLESSQTKTIIVKLSDLNRGQVSIKRLRISSTFPFGLFYAWKFWLFSRDFIVFVRPSEEKLPLPEPTAASKEKGCQAQKQDLGADEFLGHKSFEEGMPYRGIDWKAYSRGKGLLYKTFVEEAQAHFIIRPKKSLEDHHDENALEAELEKLTSLIDRASSDGLTYAVSFFERESFGEGKMALQFGHGLSHKREMLKRVALFRSSRQVLI